MCKCMSTAVCVNDTVQFTFFLIMRFNTTIIKSYDSLIVIIVTQFFSSLKFQNGLKKHVRNIARIKHGFVELVVILFTLNTRCDYVIPYDFSNKSFCFAQFLSSNSKYKKRSIML